ncbi:MAG: pantoate--beta-alanine ligase, partial [Rhodospirillaceae bacterium]
FVNPTQFGPTEDFAKYPRQLDEDRFRVGMAGAALVFAPTVEEMYPAGFCTTVTVEGPSHGLCGDARPGHFQGVATVVTKLLLQCLPDVAVFGEKDYQQLQVIRRLARDLDIPVKIDGAPIVREMDGLAMSSRNAYLSDQERPVANLMYKALHKASVALHDGAPVADTLAAARAEIAAAGFGKIDYLDLRDADTLAPVDTFDRPARLFCAAFLGKTRLIDNLPVTPRG